MATLDLIWPSEGTYRLWAWDLDPNTIHQTVTPVKEFQKHVYLANICILNQEPYNSVIIKTARGENEIGNMDQEYGIYENQLRHLQGDAIPKCYGYFKGKFGGIEMGCLLLEYCFGPPVSDFSEYNRQVMLAVCKIHQAGVSHGDLLDGYHVVRMGNSVRIVDFALASGRHICRNSVPILMGSFLHNGPTSCAELRNIEIMYGFSGDRLASMKDTSLLPVVW